MLDPSYHPFVVAFEDEFWAVPTTFQIEAGDLLPSAFGERPEDWVSLFGDFGEAYKLLAVRQHLDEWKTLISSCSPEFNMGKKRWLVLTTREASHTWEDEADAHLDNHVLIDLSQSNRGYFDRERWKNDSLERGRGTLLAPYDNFEIRQPTHNGTYLIYRQK